MGVEGHNVDRDEYGHPSSPVFSQSRATPQHQYQAPHPQYPPSQATQQQPRSKKRKIAGGDHHQSEPLDVPNNFIDLTGDSPPRKRQSKVKAAKSATADGTKSTKQTSKPKDEEKRLRRWRKHAPSSYLEVRDRALTQRMFVINRERLAAEDYPTETISLAGTTGNIYTITVDKVPSCDCPHARKGNYCKHLAYVMSRVLRAPPQLEYQIAFVSSELHEIFGKAPPLPSEVADKGEEQGGNRKAVEGECPICCVDFEPDSREKIVYCKTACGNNVHADCFQQWAATKKATRTAVTCPFCRSPWQSDTSEETASGAVDTNGPKNAEGYVNVAQQLGLSGRRDYSSYHSYWVRRQANSGEISWDEDGVMQHDRY